MDWLALIVGSVVGGVSRYVVSTAIGHSYESPFPFGTLAVNICGCIIVGFLSSAGGVKFPFPESARLLLVTGFCGGFTTFSALVLETTAMARGGAWTLAASYVGCTFLLGFAAFFAGTSIGRLI